MLFRWLVVGALVSGVLACETGVAFEGSVLSVPRSLMANADVALLKNFSADSLKQCMEQCCTGRFGACSVASYRKNTTSGNCLHFYCRPLSKCKFHPDEQIDSFSFSSNPTPIPSKPPLSTTVGLKNDNTTVKPRKGVDDDFAKSSSIKPRKGVSLDDDLPLSEFLPPPLGGKSNVKARKGVEAPPSSTSSAVIVSSMMTTTPNNDDLMDLEMILADDSTTTTTVEPSTSTVTPTSSTSLTTVVVPTTSTTLTATTISSSTYLYVSTTTRNTVQSSTTTRTRTPPLMTTSVFETSTVPPSGEIEANHLVASTIDKDKEDEENDRRYTSSIHLVLSLVFGLLVLVAVLGVVAKRIYDGWLRRDYYRMNYLIDGIYNGVE